MEQNEDHDNDPFLFKSHIELGITSHTTLPEVITNALNITPTRYFKEGDTEISRFTGNIIERPHNLWAVKSEATITEEVTISHHIEFFRTLLKGKEEILKRYIDDPSCEVSLWIWIETDDAGIGLDLFDSEMSFMASISNRIHFSVVADADEK